MSTPILTTKLYTPPPRPNVVLRARLSARLNEGLHRKLTLISAPAGFGKTTLVSTWLAGCGRPVAWLSLDESDSEPARFLTYLVAAVQMIAPAVGAGVMRMLQSPQPPSPEAILTSLLNEIAAIPDTLVLVLDDYHVIDARPIDDALTFLLDHQPPQLHLVITTREDPQLPLARLRARGQMTEMRAADLRFTAAEAAAFLTDVMGLRLSAADSAALGERTEGWVAGLQLAALSLQGQQDVPSFIRAFAGDHRYIVDYLVGEVLQRQPDHIRSFLLQTSILERLSGPLCDAVLDQRPTTQDELSTSAVRRPSASVLEALHRGNFFVVALDDTRQWYRYHHLFAEVLAAHLMAEQPDRVSTLHQRASAWYEQHGSAAAAIRHALAAQDFARAAGLIELAVPEMRRSRQEATLLGWLKALPDEVLDCRPVLNAGYAGALLSSGELQGVEARLLSAERWLGTTADRPAQPGAATAMVVVDEVALRRLPGSIAVWRAGQGLALGDLPTTVAHARRALSLALEDDHLMRGAAASLLGIASWTIGDLDAGHQGYAEGMAQMQLAGHIADVVGCAIALADIRIAQGRLHEAMRTYQHALQLALAQGEPVVRGTAGLYVGMSEIQRERNDLPAAAQHLLRSQELGEHTGLPQHRYRWRVAMARLQAAQGDLDGALALLDEAEPLYVPDFFPNVCPVAALKARVWLAQGRLGQALDWARAQGLAAHDQLSYLREFEHITLARVLLARASSEPAGSALPEAMGLLDRLLRAAEAGGRMGSLIEILLLLSLAHQAQGDLPAALVPLERAVTLSEGAGYVRLFVDQGPAMLRLLSAAAAQGMVSSNVEMLLAAFPNTEDRGPRTESLEPTRSAHSPQPSSLVEPLSERERDVLRLLATYLSGPEIARELIVSLNTMRTHTKNIYAKLGVNNRQAAVRRAEELGLF